MKTISGVHRMLARRRNPTRRYAVCIFEENGRKRHRFENTCEHCYKRQVLFYFLCIRASANRRIVESSNRHIRAGVAWVGLASGCSGAELQTADTQRPSTATAVATAISQTRAALRKPPPASHSTDGSRQRSRSHEVLLTEHDPLADTTAAGRRRCCCWLRRRQKHAPWRRGAGRSSSASSPSTLSSYGRLPPIPRGRARRLLLRPGLLPAAYDSTKLSTTDALHALRDLPSAIDGRARILAPAPRVRTSPPRSEPQAPAAKAGNTTNSASCAAATAPAAGRGGPSDSARGDDDRGPRLLRGGSAVSGRGRWDPTLWGCWLKKKDSERLAAIAAIAPRHRHCLSPAASLRERASRRCIGQARLFLRTQANTGAPTLSCASLPSCCSSCPHLCASSCDWASQGQAPDDIYRRGENEHRGARVPNLAAGPRPRQPAGGAHRSSFFLLPVSFSPPHFFIASMSSFVCSLNGLLPAPDSSDSPRK